MEQVAARATGAQDPGDAVQGDRAVLGGTARARFLRRE
ncbi:MAG: hypothetical protein AVDCRST_MAG59-5151 [uncultured Thermomicrobiales bacterium]|uniref:Uncharacterized protein n=1 Tax=uncultured Thermomicrobiales bacterium TaxID=1645740 RepID=A0A6J4VP12_9BACT|nr:MAG: hypothetical protein AVDCRST_MAG59-5151 [uncultured Thermomicrobiales bacterium]